MHLAGSLNRWHTVEQLKTEGYALLPSTFGYAITNEMIAKVLLDE